MPSSTKRIYENKFLDEKKQNAINIFLGNYIPEAKLKIVISEDKTKKEQLIGKNEVGTRKESPGDGHGIGLVGKSEMKAIANLKDTVDDGLGVGLFGKTGQMPRDKFRHLMDIWETDCGEEYNDAVLLYGEPDLDILRYPCIPPITHKGKISFHHRKI